MLAEIGRTISHFGLGLTAIALFLVGTSGICLLAPGSALKVIATIALGVVCIFGFMWIAPEFTSGGTRESVESDIKGLYDSVVDIGKGFEFDIFGDYRHNKWLNAQREKHESGFYEDDNGKKYYNAARDKEYNQIPSGQWQEVGLWNTPIDNPFETPSWRPLTASSQIAGYWSGTNEITVPADTNAGIPAFTVQFSAYIRGKQDSIDIGFKNDVENYIDALLTAYPDSGLSKQNVWAAVAEKSKNRGSALEFGQYTVEMNDKNVPPENILNSADIQINSSGTKIKIIISGNVFGISGPDSMECIISKE